MSVFYKYITLFYNVLYNRFLMIYCKHLMSVVAIVGLMTISVFAKEENVYGRFKYPLQPSMEEWGQINHGERVLASQIPK